MIAVAYWTEAAQNVALAAIGAAVGVTMLLYVLADWSVRSYNRNRTLTPEQLKAIVETRAPKEPADE